LQALAREGILVGRHGPHGGYVLAKGRQAISVYDIFEAVKTLETGKSKIELPWWPPALAQAEQCFASALDRISVEDLVQAASLQMLASYEPDAIARPSKRFAFVLRS